MTGSILRIAAWALAVVLTALPIVAVVQGWYATERWPFKRLQLTAEYRHVQAEQVQAAVAPLLARGYFAVDLDAIRQAIARLPWVASVEVRKHWPDALEVSIREHQPLARWGRDELVSTRGAVFAMPADAQTAELPELSGPQQGLQQVLGTWRSAERLLAEHALAARALRLSARGSWRLTLSGGTEVVIGRGDPLPRLARFAALLPALLEAEARPLLRADLRYGNGFALRWAEPQVQSNGIES